MRFDRALQNGAEGGHGPIRYHVTDYRPSSSIRFAFDRPAGFDGSHQFEVIPTGPSDCVLRHSLNMSVSGLARLTWPLVFRPLHNALIEDALGKAQGEVSRRESASPKWGPSVRTLRWLLRLVARRRAQRRGPVASNVR